MRWAQMGIDMQGMHVAHGVGAAPWRMAVWTGLPALPTASTPCAFGVSQQE